MAKRKSQPKRKAARKRVDDGDPSWRLKAMRNKLVAKLGGAAELTATEYKRALDRHYESTSRLVRGIENHTRCLDRIATHLERIASILAAEQNSESMRKARVRALREELRKIVSVFDSKK